MRDISCAFDQRQLHLFRPGRVIGQLHGSGCGKAQGATVTLPDPKQTGMHGPARAPLLEKGHFEPALFHRWHALADPVRPAQTEAHLSGWAMPTPSLKSS